MNQIPNIEETHNTREGIEGRFWKMMEQTQFVKSTNSVTDTVEEYPPAIVDMEATVSINGEFDKYAIDEWHHQELQKAREEERKKVLWNIGAMIEEADFARKVTERTGEALPILEVQAVIKQVQIMLDRYHSELDQSNK